MKTATSEKETATASTGAKREPRTHYGPDIDALTRTSRTRCGIKIMPEGNRVKKLKWTEHEHIVTCRLCSPWLD